MQDSDDLPHDDRLSGSKTPEGMPHAVPDSDGADHVPSAVLHHFPLRTRHNDPDLQQVDKRPKLRLVPSSARDAESSDEQKRTLPPVSAMRYPTPQQLFRDLPEICDFVMQRPQEDEDGLDFLMRLRASTTPEEAVTYTAFAIRPEQAAGWGYECLRAMADHLNPMERPMMEMIAAWLAHPNIAMRHRVMREALYAASRSPSVLLGLAVGWSSGGPAPNDDLPSPVWRTPQAINSAVLSCLSRATLTDRPIFLARFIDMAEIFFREY